MKLNLGTKIGRYEVRSLIGAGGMGEVYLAHDTQLERDVALKLLKQDDDAEKLQRFRREAKVVSSLNHPNILTIHDFGEHQDFHYIISELVKGKSLRTLIAEKKLSFTEILDIIIQVATALAVAHEESIVHRDIKPENVMVLPDGYVKVLDFGLAKLVGLEKNLAANPDVSTVSLIETQRGLIVGTINYMSPEQLRGQEIDQRTDVWSSGVVLFEMLTGERPFAGDSVSDVIAAVLQHPLPDFAQKFPQIPNELGAIVGKALQKEKSGRYQTAKDFIADLKIIRNHLQSQNQIATAELTPSMNLIAQRESLTTDSNQTAAATIESRTVSILKKTRRILLALVLLVLFSGGIAYLYQKYYAAAPSFRQMKIRRLPTSGDVSNAAISPDGRFIVYVKSENGDESLWLRQVEETGGTELLAPTVGRYAALTFSPDGNSIYFTKFEQAFSGNLFRLPILGGSRQEIARDVDSTPAFSPNGGEITYLRHKPQTATDEIIVSNFDGTNERVLLEKKLPEFLSIATKESPAWSPDGKTIACPSGRNDAGGEFMTVVGVDVATGQEKPLTSDKWLRVGRIAWTQNADELLITAVDFGEDYYKIFKIFRSGAKPQNVTSDLMDYYNLSVQKDSTRLLGITTDKTSSLYLASVSKPSQTRQISGGLENAKGVVWANDNRIIFTSMESGNRDIWATDAKGQTRRQLTFDKAADDYPSVSNDGKIVFVSFRTNSQHLWQMNPEGGELKQLTNSGGESFPAITPDGKSVVYSLQSSGSYVLWKIGIDGGEPVQLTDFLSHWAAISPDGKLIACLNKSASLDKPIRLSVVSAADGKLLDSFPIPFGVAMPDIVPAIRWMPDGKAVSYIATINGISNLWKQPLNGEKEQLTDFTAEKIYSFDWSKDGKQIVYARGVDRNNLILIEDF